MRFCVAYALCVQYCVLVELGPNVLLFSLTFVSEMSKSVLNAL